MKTEEVIESLKRWTDRDGQTVPLAKEAIRCIERYRGIAMLMEGSRNDHRAMLQKAVEHLPEEIRYECRAFLLKNKPLNEP